jgi:hypothetical protein
MPCLKISRCNIQRYKRTLTTIGKTGGRQRFEANHKVLLYRQLGPPVLKREALVIQELFLLGRVKNSVAGPSLEPIKVFSGG